MHRRHLIFGLATLSATCSLGAVAQGIPQVAVLLAGVESDPEYLRWKNAFLLGLEEQGLYTGRNIAVHFGWGTADPARLREVAQSLVSFNPAVNVGFGTAATRAMRSVMSATPLVFTNVSDPVGEGFVKTLPKPGSNLTGFTNIEPSMAGKYIELLRELEPDVTQAHLLFNPETTPGRGAFFTGSFMAASVAANIKPVLSPVREPAQITTELGAAAQARGGVIVVGEPFMNRHRSQILRLVSLSRLPCVFPYRFYVSEGGILSYGVDAQDLFRRSASYVGRILGGENPSTLPVQAPNKFELAVNQTSADLLGVRLPTSILIRADVVL